MGIRSFIRGIREEIFPETLVSKLEELEELDKKIMNLKVSKDTVVFKKSAMKALERIDEWGLSNYPVCIAKTQYSLSDDAKRAGVPKDFTFTIRDLVINTGAEMIVAIAGDILRMPGLPKDPQANHIDFVDGEIVGLS